MLGGAVLWGTAGTAMALSPPGAQTWQMATLRLLAGGAVLLALAAATGHAGALPRPRLVALAAAVAMAVFQLAYFAAVTRAGVAVGTAVAIGSGPVFAGAIERLALGVRPERRWWPATTLAVVGVALLLGAAEGPAADPGGVAGGLVAGAAFAGFAVASRRVLGDADPTATMGWLLGLAGVLLVPVAALLTAATGAGLAWAASPSGASAVAWLALAATGAAYALFGRGLARVPAGRATTLALAEPLAAAVLGVGLLGERPTVAEGLGAVLVLAGLAVLSLRRPAASG